MKHLIKKLLREMSEIDEEKAFNQREIVFFKFLNTFKKSVKPTERELSNFINSHIKSFGLKPEDSNEYLMVYTQNYREDGKYNEIKKSELKNYHSLKKQRTSNQNASALVGSLKPFKASNLEGEWEKDKDGEWAYVVISWGWYPVYMYKYKNWFEVSDSYSPSTSKQMSQSNPRRYNNAIGETMIIVSRGQMNKLREGYLTTNRLISDNNENLIKTIEKQKNQLVQARLGWDPRIRIGYKFIDASIENDVPTISVEIVKVDKMDGMKIDRESGDFFKDEMVGVNKDYVTNLMEDKITDYVSNLLGRRIKDKIVINVSYKN